MIKKLIRKLSGVEAVEKQLEFVFSLQIAMLRRYAISEEEISKLITEEEFISELYANKLIKLIKDKNVD